MGHNFLPSFTPFFTSFFTSFFRLSFVNLIVIMSAFYPENRPLTSCVLSVRRRRDYTLDGIFSGILNVPKWHKIRWSVMPKRNRIDTFDDYDRRHTHTFPWVLLGFLHIFSNKNPVRRGFLEGYLIAFSDSHFGITTRVSLPHSISMTTSSDDARRSATK